MSNIKEYLVLDSDTLNYLTLYTLLNIKRNVSC